MIVTGEKPWEGESRYGSWRELEPLWDGQRRFEYVEPVSNFHQIMRGLRLPNVLRGPVAWLEDQLFPTALSKTKYTEK